MAADRGTLRRPILAAGGLLLAAGLAAWLLPGPLESLVAAAERAYMQWLPPGDAAHPLVLLAIAAGGGLLASLSPCILALLPLNLGYMGVTSVGSRREAAFKSLLFVLGVATVLTAMGLVSSFAGFLLVEFRGYLLLAAGLMSLILALGYLNVLPVPALPGFTRVPAKAGPYVFGLAFALISSPCASPILFAVLGAAATSGSAWLGAATMATYAVAFTAVLFLGGLSVGLARSAGKLAAHGRKFELAGGALLGAAGVYLLISGFRWFA